MVANTTYLWQSCLLDKRSANTSLHDGRPPTPIRSNGIDHNLRFLDDTVHIVRVPRRVHDERRNLMKSDIQLIDGVLWVSVESEAQGRK